MTLPAGCSDVNGRPTSSPELYKTINSVFAKSGFSHVSDGVDGRPHSPSPTKGTSLSKSPRHQPQKHPIFVLDIRWSSDDWVSLFTMSSGDAEVSMWIFFSLVLSLIQTEL
jgi:hypothetical protein